MFVNHFAFVMPEVGARFRQDELRGTDVMVMRARFSGGVVDESLHACSAHMSGWSSARIVLEGSLGASGVDAGSGEMIVALAGLHPARALSRSSDWMDILWRSPTRTTSVVTTLSARSLIRAKALARALEADDVDAVISTLGTLVGDLGLPLFVRGVREDAAGAFARVLWQRAMDLEHQPMAVDLAGVLGVSERHALRRTNHFLRQFHLSASSWRELVGRLRIELGTFFMTAPGAKTEDVSRFLGFSSPTAFCHAFQEAGLPSPQAVRRR